MEALPPVNDAILHALAELVNDAQTNRRDPSHDQIAFCIQRSGLQAFDPASQGLSYGKAKRVRAVLSSSLSDDIRAGQQFVQLLVEQVPGLGGFRSESPNFVRSEAIVNLREAFRTEGFLLSQDGHLDPLSLESLNGPDLTSALEKYVVRAQKGTEDAALFDRNKQRSFGGCGCSCRR